MAGAVKGVEKIQSGGSDRDRTQCSEAGEPALSIQLYARLLARYPQTALAGQARAAVESQKKRLAKR